MKVIVIVPAAGTGSRMQAGVNKQYLLLGDKPILAHTLALFDSHPLVADIVVASPPEEIPLCRAEVVERFALGKVREVVAGGRERQDSVGNALAVCRQADDDDVVIIHDGVRPFFEPAQLEEIVLTAGRVGACVVGMPVKDTVKIVRDGWIRATPERDTLWQAQTPQAFTFALIREAHERARQEGFRGTDDASLVERLGHPVAMLKGSYRNLKITTPEDLLWARTLLDLPQETR